MLCNLSVRDNQEHCGKPKNLFTSNASFRETSLSLMQVLSEKLQQISREQVNKLFKLRSVLKRLQSASIF